MCSARINGTSITPIPLPPAYHSCQKVLGSTDLQKAVCSFLPISDMHTVKNVAKLLHKPIPLNTPLLDVREKAHDFPTLKRISAEHHPQALRVKLSENWNNEVLRGRLKELPPVVSLDLTECPDITLNGLMCASKELPRLEELHLKDGDGAPLRLDDLVALGKIFPLKAIHIKYEKGGLLYSVIQHSTEEQFATVQMLPIKSIDLSALRLHRKLADPLIKQRLCKLPSLETLSFPYIYEDIPNTDPISSAHIAPFFILDMDSF